VKKAFEREFIEKQLEMQKKIGGSSILQFTMQNAD